MSQNDEATRQGRPDTNTISCSHDTSERGERAVFDVRVEVTAPEATDVFHLINLFLLLARRVAPAGVNVRYSSLKATNGSFRPTITPKRGRVA